MSVTPGLPPPMNLPFLLETSGSRSWNAFIMRVLVISNSSAVCVCNL